MTTTAIIPLSPPVNLRDLAGIPISGGEVILEGFAIRADDLSIITEDVAEGLVGQGLRAVIDLRSPAEFGVTGRGPLGAMSSVTYHNVPLLDGIEPDPDDLASYADQSRFGSLYRRMFENEPRQIVSCLAIIAYTPGAVAFHCAAGQDRTGVLAAALLLALGADPEDIVVDYARTAENSAAIGERIMPVIAPLLEHWGVDLNELAEGAVRKAFSDVPMRELLAGLQERHGDAMAPLRAAGLTDGLIARLRERALAVAAV